MEANERKATFNLSAISEFKKSENKAPNEAIVGAK